MEKFDTTTGEEANIINGELATLFKVMSNPDTLKILYRAGMGIENSTFAMKELDLTSKKYYSRLRDLIDIGLIRKKDRIYRQTALGRMIYDRFLPAMGKAVDARDEMELIVYLEGSELDNDVIKRIEDELGIPAFEESPKMKLLRDYEALAIEAIDLYDSAEKSVFLATNYLDVRVIEAFLRAIDRGVTNKVIIGKNRQSSKLQTLRMMLSVTFAKVVINFASETGELNNTVRFADLPYTFCVVDGHHNLVDLSNAANESFAIALSIDDRGVSESLTKFYETIWEAGEVQSVIEAIDSLKSS